MRKIWRGFAAAAAGAAALLSLSDARSASRRPRWIPTITTATSTPSGLRPRRGGKPVTARPHPVGPAGGGPAGGMPEGTFGYAITRTTMMFGLYMIPRCICPVAGRGRGLYRPLRDEDHLPQDPAYYATSDLSLCDEDFKLNGDDAIEEFQARAMYNRNVEYGSYTDQYGDWDTITWYCDATTDSVSVDDETGRRRRKTSGRWTAAFRCGGNTLKGYRGCRSAPPPSTTTTLPRRPISSFPACRRRCCRMWRAPGRTRKRGRVLHQIFCLRIECLFRCPYGSDKVSL